MMYWIIFLSIAFSPLHGDQQPLLKALEEGAVREFGSYYTDQVIITIFDKEQTLAKMKAITVTENFFNAYDIKGFKKNHSGTSRDGSSSYLIGTLVSETREYRTFIYFQMDGDVPVISEVQIER